MDVLIASYAQIRRDVSKLASIIRFCVLDEAKISKSFVPSVRWRSSDLKPKPACLTGTPMENHIGELWSVFDFVLPGYLGSHSAFIARFGDGGQAEELSIKIRPFLMRRIKKDVLEELPDKIEDRVLVEMNDYQQRV
jgi:SNF2 family DNA or RNA helicase